MSKRISIYNFINEGIYTINSTVRYDASAIILEHEIFESPLSKFRLLGIEDAEESYDALFSANMLEVQLSITPNDEDTAMDTVFKMQAPTLTSFFALQLIDIPLCFRKTKSLYAPVASMPHIRFINMISRHGRRQYVATRYSETLNYIALRWLTRHQDERKHPDWRPFFAAFAEPKILMLRGSSRGPSINEEVSTFFTSDIFKQELSNSGDAIESDDWVHDFIYDEIESYSPVFSFYVQKVDKMKRKHSRGKTGKYSISWKYVPKYRRIAAVLR